MKNTYKEMIACLEHLDAGGKLEWEKREGEWEIEHSDIPSFKLSKYRIPVEKYQPEVGEEVIVRDKDGHWFDEDYRYRGMVDGKYICLNREDGVLSGWDEAKPLKQPKPVAREWYAAVKSNGDLIGTVQQMGSSMLVVREVLE